MPKRMTASKYLGHGLYSISDAADILLVPADRLRHWVRGYYYGPLSARKRQTSVVPRFYGGDDEPLAFVELIELLFVAKFQRAHLSMQYIRKAAARARDQFNSDYPFAITKFSTDGRRIFAKVDIEERPRHAIHEVVSGQVVFNSIVPRFFKYHLDVEHNIAKRYWPLGRGKRVVVDAERAFGAPIDEPTGVPTVALSAAVDAGDSEQSVAEWFEVPVQAVRAARRYEHGSRAA